jgi:hypothetical protein
MQSSGSGSTAVTAEDSNTEIARSTVLPVYKELKLSMLDVNVGHCPRNK